MHLYDLPIGKVQIASDYKQVINDIAETAGGSYAPIIKEIGMHGRDFPIVNFLHEGRQSKQVHCCVITLRK
jgi:hypothetical protein